jgi:hypothetical protein
MSRCAAARSTNQLVLLRNPKKRKEPGGVPVGAHPEHQQVEPRLGPTRAGATVIPSSRCEIHDH